MNRPLTGSIERAARLHAKQVRQRLLGSPLRRRPRDVLKIGRTPEPAPQPEPEIIVLNPVPAPDPIYIAPSAKIINEVAAKHKVSAGEIKGPRRNRYIVAARFEAILRIHRELPHMSLPQIGRVFNRDHTSILHAIRKYGAQAEGEATK